MPRVIRSEGNVERTVSDYCPDCCGPIAEKVTAKVSVFDENGWYFPVKMRCGNKKCGKTWTDKIVTVPGGLHG